MTRPPNDKPKPNELTLFGMNDGVARVPSSRSVRRGKSRVRRRAASGPEGPADSLAGRESENEAAADAAEQTTGELERTDQGEGRRRESTEREVAPTDQGESRRRETTGREVAGADLREGRRRESAGREVAPTDQGESRRREASSGELIRPDDANRARRAPDGARGRELDEAWTQPELGDEPGMREADVVEVRHVSRPRKPRRPRSQTNLKRHELTRKDVLDPPGSLLAQKVDRFVGPKTGIELRKLGVETGGDLLRYIPRRYYMYGDLTEIRGLEVGEHVTIKAKITDRVLHIPRTGRKTSLKIIVTDETDTLEMIFWGNQGYLMSLQRKFQLADQGLFSGVVGMYRGRRQLTHPDYELLAESDDPDKALVEHMRPVPVYGATARLPSWRVQSAIPAVLDVLKNEHVPDILPYGLRPRLDLLRPLDAYKQVHRPASVEAYQQAQRTLRFEEAFLLQVLLARRRLLVSGRQATSRTGRAGGLRDAFDGRLPFELTRGQIEVGELIDREIATPQPMMRLLQGEVGSGKTIVALRAMLRVVDSGGQAALLAPTEVLAGQHFRTITAMLGELAEGGTLMGADRSVGSGSGSASGQAPAATRVVLLTASLPAAAKREALEAIESGEAGIVIGTHALFSEGVEFKDLGLLVVDEQHRFGVEQRDALREGLDYVAHSLIMTATPIPRTVAMTIFGDLEVSTLREIPAGRGNVETFMVEWEKRPWIERMWQRCAEEVEKGGRVYVVCPRIDEHDDGAEDDGEPFLAREGEKKSRPLASVLEWHDLLSRMPRFAGKVGVLHGRMTGEAKSRAMSDFASGRIPVMVATTVIEVGMDVPDASVMVILDADRFGLSQLHQLRGRIGRGERDAVCFAVHSSDKGSQTWQRIEAFTATRDGFELAERDLEIRREGDVLGSLQSGIASSLVSVRVLRDRALIELAREEAIRLLEADPELKKNRELLEAVLRFEESTKADYLERS